MTPRVRRSLTALALTLVALLALLPTPAAASGELTITQAEARMLERLNAERTSRGLKPYRADRRLTSIARSRSRDMVSRDYFSHRAPDGRDVFDAIAASGITWFGAGEIIAWNNHPTLAESVVAAGEGWLASPSHRAIVLSDDYNYIGIGLSLDPDDGHRLWTAVTLRGPDRTGAWSRMAGIRETRAGTATRVPVAVAWSGRDVQLQVFTAGLRTYQVQRRVDGARWKTVWTTTWTRVVRWHAKGHTYEYRVRGIDRRGNPGPWSAPLKVTT